MKKIISAAMAAACVVPSQAENTQTKLDTTNVQNISEVVVKGCSRSSERTIRHH